MSYIEIVLKSDLCAGSGESRGNVVDNDLCLDDKGLPFIPARRLRGCLREAAESLRDMGYAPARDEEINSLFGTPFGEEGAFELSNAYLDGYYEMKDWLSQEGHEVGVGSDIGGLFSYVRGQTRLENGTKVDNTLRFTRVLHHYDPLYPTELKETSFRSELVIEDEDRFENLFEAICRATRHIGTGRNRGLGNVSVRYVRQKKASCNVEAAFEESGDEEAIRTIRYYVALDAPVTLPGYGGVNSTSIPARSVIGCIAETFLKTGIADSAEFENLFLNGNVRWSALTPVIGDTISDPTPLFLMKLKNGGGRIIQSYSETGSEWKGLKPKTMDGSYSSLVTDPATDCVRYLIGVPGTHTLYHNSLRGEQLYMQDSIDAGVVYGGTVQAAEKEIKGILKLLTESRFRFGRSKGAQYATCSLVYCAVDPYVEQKRVSVPAGEPIFVILRSDLVMDEGCYVTDTDNVRALLAETLGVRNVSPEGYADRCSYYTLGGFHTQWHLQKPHIPAARAGSVYCFESDGRDIPREFTAGEFPQEGFGCCRVLTTRDPEWTAAVEEAGIMEHSVQRKTDTAERLEGLFLGHMALEEMKAFAVEVWENLRRDKSKKYPVGRLRAMLNDASNLDDLRKQISGMKESDLSSEIQVSRKESCRELVRKVYGAGSSPFEEIRRSGRTDLWDRVEKNSVAKGLVDDEWKMMLENVLHRMHYDR